MAAQIVTLLATEVQGGWWKPSTWRTNWRGALRRGVYTLAVVWMVTFAICIVTTIYDDHRALSDRLRIVVNENNRLKSELQNTDSSAKESRNIQVRRKIESDLSEFIAEDNKLRDEWRIAMGQPDKTIQTTFASKAKQKHSEIDTYLRTIPRGSVYSARLNGYPRTVCAGYPLGHADELCRELETLEADTNALGEFIKDPDLGRP
jgi:hypothetical protein